MALLPDPSKETVWFKGYISLNKVPMYLKVYHPLCSMSYPMVRRAVEDKALVVVEIGNNMRVTQDSLESFVKQVEEGHYSLSNTHKTEAPTTMKEAADDN